jgi:putative nucleotidyltransferase with HDIG domain
MAPGPSASEPVPLRVLIVEDSESDAVLMLHHLKARGYAPEFERVETAESMRAALLSGRDWDVVLSDYSLPTFDAPHALRVLQDTDLDIPFIIVSGTIGEETAVEAMKAGAHDFLLKDNLIRLAPAIEREREEAKVRAERNRAQVELAGNVERLGRALDETIRALTRTSELRDPYTAGHQRRVSSLACAVSDRLSLAPQQRESIRVAGLLHDLGKIAVPAEILSKPGSLSPREFELVKEHSEVGFDILRGIEFGAPVARFVVQHHERLDGSGYPHGLTSADIAIESKVLAVADVVEAMSSHRPYRPALGIEAARQEIVDKAGITFDADIVDACAAVLEEGFSFDDAKGV